MVVELDADCLELTPECSLNAKAASTQDEVDRFYRKYGMLPTFVHLTDQVLTRYLRVGRAFATSFTLGGYLYNTRNVTKDEQANLDQHRSRM